MSRQRVGAASQGLQREQESRHRERGWRKKESEEREKKYVGYRLKSINVIFVGRGTYPSKKTLFSTASRPLTVAESKTLHERCFRRRFSTGSATSAGKGKREVRAGWPDRM